MFHGTLDRVRDSKGFTLIELLIVVVIIGILAAIAIPQFASTKESAFDAAAKSDLRNAMAAVEAFYTQNLDYPSGSGDDTMIDDFSSSENVTFTYTSQNNNQGYYLQAESMAQYDDGTTHKHWVCGGSSGDGEILGPSASFGTCS